MQWVSVYECVNGILAVGQDRSSNWIVTIQYWLHGVFLPLYWLGFFKYSFVKWMCCSSSCILCCSFKFFSWVFNTKFCAYYLAAVLLLYREQATVAPVSVPLILHLLSSGWNILGHFHFCLCCSWIVATLHSD